MSSSNANSSFYWMDEYQEKTSKSLGKVKREIVKLKEENLELKRQLKDAEKHIPREEERETW